MCRDIYTERQVEMLRNALKETYERANKTEKLSWAKIAKLIVRNFERLSSQERLEIPLPYRNIKTFDFGNHDNLRKFADRDIYEMLPIKMLALAFWLTSNSVGWIPLTKEKLFNQPRMPKVALLFAEFLHENAEDDPYIKPDHLVGTYFVSDDNVEIELNIYEGINEHALQVRVYEYRTIRHRHNLNVTGGVYEVVYVGWLVIAPNDSLFCILKNETEYCNNLYITLGLDENFMEKGCVSQIVFLNQPILAHFDSEECNEDISSILTSWLSQNENNFIKFQRVTENS